MSAGNINELLEIWASTLPSDQDPPFINKQDLYSTIDGIKVGNVPWQSFSVSFNGKFWKATPHHGKMPAMRFGLGTHAQSSKISSKTQILRRKWILRQNCA
jgi:hypothetical protein